MKRMICLLLAGALTACARPSPIPAVPAVPVTQGLPLVDLTDDFARFQAASVGIDKAERVTAFKRHFEPLIPGFYDRTTVGPFDYGDLILKALDAYPEQRAGIEQVSRTFQSMAVPARSRFEALFGPMGSLPPIILLHSLGEMDGGVRTLPGTGRTLVFGADVIARLHLAHGAEPFVHHELFHVFHGNRFTACDAVWCDLWSEGLAVYASELLNPGASDAQLLLTEPTPLRAAVERNRKAAFAELLPLLDSTSREGSGALFSNGKGDGALPPRAGYYLGYLVAREAGKTRTPQQLAAMGQDEVRPMVREIVKRLAAEGR